MLPTFVVIGAPKAGTTSLHRYLAAHPQVFMSEPKELHFFVRDRAWRYGPGWYEERFAAAGGARARGESSPGYALAPHWPSMPGRMAALLPDARLVYLVRDPVERAISHFAQQWMMGRERKTIVRALLENPLYLDGSRYAFQIERYLEHYPRERILILCTEDLLDRRRETVRRVLRFIGVDETWTAPELDRLHNATAGQPGGLRWAVRVRRSPAYRRVRHLLPARLRREVTRLITRPLPPLEVPAEVRDALWAELAGDMARFRSIAGVEVGEWRPA
jgi:hypothetical protein